MRSRASPRREPWAARSRTGIPASGHLRRSRMPSSASRQRSRLRARSTFPFTLTARTENLLRGNPDLDDTIARLQAYEAAGADVLYAPGLATVEQIEAVCSALSKPVNVLARPSLSFEEIAGAGAQRVSVGGALTWTAVGAFVDAARAIGERGDFSSARLGLSARRLARVATPPRRTATRHRSARS